MNEIEPETRSRHLIYTRKGKTVILKVTVTYAPDLEKVQYGHIRVDVIYPIKKSMTSGFPLDLFPNVRDKIDPATGHYIGIEDNIEDVETGIRRLFIEGNKHAGLLVKSTLHLTKKEFSYNDMCIADLDVTPPLLRGRVEVGDEMLRKGDIIWLEELNLSTVGAKTWRYVRPKIEAESFWQKVSKWFCKHFTPSDYRYRYLNDFTDKVNVDNVRVLGGVVEKETYQ